MTAKQRLQTAPNLPEIAKMLQSGLFDYCCDVALLTLVESMGATTVASDSPQAAALHYQLSGAKRILAILKDLATIPSEPKANKIGQLNPQ